MGDKNKENNSGGPNMPRILNVVRFAEARAQEVKKMISDLRETNGTKLIFQTLPKHMRRRTMSHKVKRLPHTHREGHLNQLRKSGMPVKNKRPSRKFRRKPANLLSEYFRRTRRISWLETHIWHAKRFHMVEKWGYKLPHRACDKNFRSCYRASSKHCLLQDISFYTCLEVKGNQFFILEGLKLVTNTNSGLTFGAKAFLSGSREGRTILYQKDSYPLGAIGPVSFQWNPHDKNTLWLWVHPLILPEVINLFQTIFEPQKVTFRALKNFFNRFRLTGPLSNAIISNVFKAPSPKNTTKWYDSFLNCSENRQIFSDQCHFLMQLKSIASPSEISPHLVVNFISIDPRYNFPLKRSKATPDFENGNNIFSNYETYKFGEIWNLTTKNFVEKSKKSTAQFLKDRATQIVTDPEEIPDSVSVLPVMIIQRPGVSDSKGFTGYGAGWDIIIPPGWALPVWLCLIMWRAKVGGLRETDTIQYEMGRYDQLPPDTKAGKIENNEVDQSYRIKYFRLPPAKRVNYTKFGICSPFRCDWEKLLADWTPEENRVDDFYVLRDRLVLAQIQEILKSKSTKPNLKLHQFNDIVSNLVNKNCLVPVKLFLIKKGKASRFAIICLPDHTDFEKKLDSVSVEPKRTDPNQRKRNKLRNEHKLFLKRMSRKRGRAKKNGKVTTFLNTLCDSTVLQRPVEEINKFHSQIQSLWLPEPQNIKDSCSRTVIGFITKGDVSFITGCGLSIGFVPLVALRSLLGNSNRTDRVLVRNTNSRRYRFAKMDVICTNF